MKCIKSTPVYKLPHCIFKSTTHILIITIFMAVFKANGGRNGGRNTVKF